MSEYIKHYRGVLTDASCDVLFYLNDNFTGGQTEFLPGIMVEPVKGSVVAFPPNWQHPHCGLPVETGNKYIMSTYLRYV
jgi:prolyl 4-hydroxylase